MPCAGSGTSLTHAYAPDAKQEIRMIRTTRLCVHDCCILWNPFTSWCALATSTARRHVWPSVVGSGSTLARARGAHVTICQSLLDSSRSAEDPVTSRPVKFDRPSGHTTAQSKRAVATTCVYVTTRVLFRSPVCDRRQDFKWPAQQPAVTQMRYGLQSMLQLHLCMNRGLSKGLRTFISRLPACRGRDRGLVMQRDGKESLFGLGRVI